MCFGVIVIINQVYVATVDKIAPANVYFLSNVVRYNKPNRCKNHSSNLLFAEMDNYFQSRDFKFLFNYKQFLIRIQINNLVYSF